MSCSEAIAELSAAVDGELGLGRHRQLDDHLAGCPACAPSGPAAGAAPAAPLRAGRGGARRRPPGAGPSSGRPVRPGGVDNRRPALPSATLPTGGLGASSPGSGVGPGVAPAWAAAVGGGVPVRGGGWATFIGLGRGGPGQVPWPTLPARVVAAQRTLPPGAERVAGRAGLASQLARTSVQRPPPLPRPRAPASS